MNEPGKVWQDNSRRVWTHKKNSGETVRRLGTIIQSIFCAQSGAGMSKAVHDKLSKSSPKHTFLPGTRKNQKETEATNGIMRLLSLGHLSFRICSKQLGVINHWLPRQIDKKLKNVLKTFLRCESSWCLFHQSVPRSWQINFRKRVDLRKKGGYTQATSSFQFGLVNISTAHDLARSLAS